MKRDFAGRWMAGVYVVALLWASIAETAFADRPAAPDLLPADTLAYLRLRDVPQARTRLKQTGMGQLVQDPRIQPLVLEVYRIIEQQTAPLEMQLGAPLPSVLGALRGELCAAVVDPGSGRPTWVLLVDVKEAISTANAVLEQIGARLQERGGQRSVEIWRNATLTVWTYGNADEGRQLVWFVQDGTLVVLESFEQARKMLAVWEGDEAQPQVLARNEKFRATMDRCREPDHAPDLELFVQPIQLLRAIGRGNLGLQAGLAMVPALGLDAVEALGGSVTIDTGPYDSVMHLHLLLSQPRTGVLEMLALRPVEADPESWVPADAATYVTLQWDIKQTYRALTSLYDSFSGEGALQRAVDRRWSERLGIDFNRDVVDQLTGRFSLVAWVEPAKRPDSRVRMFAAQVADRDKIRSTLDQMATRLGDRLAPQSFSGVTYYRDMRPARRRPAADAPDQQDARPARQPCIAVLQDYLLLTDSEPLLQQAILASHDPNGSLRSTPQYQRVRKLIQQRLGETRPVLIGFDQPEETFRMIYEFLTSDVFRSQLDRSAEEQPIARAIRDALQQHVLPPFGELRKYMAPVGSFVTDERSGLHYVSFSLKPPSSEKNEPHGR